MGVTTIQWTNRVWNPVRGCSRVSKGCVNCYAERQALRFAGRVNEQQGAGPFAGFVQITNGHPQWTGKVQIVEKHVADPLRWLDPQMIFVNSMSDLWHEKLSLDDDADIYAVMAAANWHTYQVLTKRPEIRLDAFQNPKFAEEVEERAIDIIANWEGRAGWVGWKFQWPLPNVWEGVSVEDQRNKGRIDLLRQTPAAVRFLSIEPLLEDIGHLDLRSIHWVIVGGESGPSARPFDIAWARNIVEQCKAAGVACFVKQVGAHVIQDGERRRKADRKGGDWHEWPHDIRVREFPVQPGVRV